MSDTCIVPTCESHTTCWIDKDWNLYFCNNHVVGVEDGEIRIPIMEFLANRMDPDRVLSVFAIEADKVGIDMVVFYDVSTNSYVIQFYIRSFE